MAAFSHLYSSALHQELGTDDSTQLFTDARRKNAINNGALTFADLTECAVRQTTVTCSNGVAEYNLLSTVNVPGGDFLRVASQGPEYQLMSSGGASSRSTQFIAGPDLPPREIWWLNQYEPGWRSSTGGSPHAYYERMDGGQRLLGLVPPPRIPSSQVGVTLLPYVAKPSTMTADTSIPFTFGSTTRDDLEPYHQALAHYAASELEKLRLDTDASARQLTFFLSYVERFLRTMRPHGPKTIGSARQYFGESRRRFGAEQVSEEWHARRLCDPDGGLSTAPLHLGKE